MNRTIIGTHCPPIPYLGDERPHVLLAVLVQEHGLHGYKVAYQGIVESSTDETVARVASRGIRLHYEEAVKHWPSLSASEYQR